MATKHHNPTNPQPNPITIDPSAQGHQIRLALVVESALNIFFSLYILLYPSHALYHLSYSPRYVNPLSSSLLHILAIMVWTITVPLLLAIPNTRQGIESRVPAYLTLGTSEVFLLGMLGWLGFVKGEGETGVSDRAVAILASNITGALAWRVFVLWVKPEWVGRYKDEGKIE